MTAYTDKELADAVRAAVGYLRSKTGTTARLAVASALILDRVTGRRPYSVLRLPGGVRVIVEKVPPCDMGNKIRQTLQSRKRNKRKATESIRPKNEVQGGGKAGR